MDLSSLHPARGFRKNRKRVGRGQSSGHGGTSCRGHKGQNARKSGGVRPGFEGGQMPLIRRIPKRGFFNRFSKIYAAVNIEALDRCFDAGEVVDCASLQAKGLLKKARAIKILGTGELSKALAVKVHGASKSAQEKIKKAGGTIEFIR